MVFAKFAERRDHCAIPKYRTFSRYRLIWPPFADANSALADANSELADANSEFADANSEFADANLAPPTTTTPPICAPLGQERPWPPRVALCC